MAEFRAEPVLAFDIDSADFVRGFEVGNLWALLNERPHDEVEEYVHASNTEMVLRLAEATGRRAISEELGAEWLLVRFSVAGGR